MNRFRPYWPHARAALILLHFAAVLTLCSPDRHKMLQARGWESARANASFAAWAKRLSSVGISTTPAGLKSFWRRLAERYVAAREFVGAPAEVYESVFYIGQGWSLFSSPKREPALLVVDIHDAAGWRPLYRSRSGSAEWRRRMFDHNRIRKLLGRISRHEDSLGLYGPIGDWIARMAASEFPSADRIRTRLWRYTTLPPGTNGDPIDGRYTDDRVIELASLR